MRSLAANRFGSAGWDVWWPSEDAQEVRRQLADVFSFCDEACAEVLRIEQGIPPFRVWYEKYSWTINAQLAGGSLVILLGMLRQTFGAQVLFLTIPFCIMTYHFYKAYFPRASQKAHKT